MKTIKQITTLLIILLSLQISAQNIVELNGKGIDLNKSYTKAEITAIFGEPTKYSNNTEDEFERYDYPHLTLRYYLGDLIGASVSSSIYTMDVYGTKLKVGDSFEKVRQMAPKGVLLAIPYPEDTYYQLRIGDSDDIYTFTQKDGKITYIGYSFPI